MSGPGTLFDDDVALAAEYVLRLLEPDEERAFSRRMRDEADLRALVQNWQEAFAGLADEVEEVSAPGRVKRTLERRLFDETGEAAPSRGAGVALWRWLSAGVLAAALVLGAVLLPVLQPPEPAVFTAAIASEDGDFTVRVRVDPETGQGRLIRRAGAAPPGRVLELWILTEEMTGPQSLGTITEPGAYEFTVPPEIRPDLPGATVEVSEEPPGGSPTGSPTGDVLGIGNLSET